jgi:hypothetical protein
MYGGLAAYKGHAVRDHVKGSAATADRTQRRATTQFTSNYRPYVSLINVFTSL